MAGRKSKYQVQYAKQAFQLCLLGATDVQIAEFFEVSEVTLNAWKKKYPAFLKSIKTAKLQADSEVAASLFKRAKGFTKKAVKIFQFQGKEVIVPYVEFYPPETVAAIFWLKNRQPELWRDKQDHEHTGKNGGPIETKWTNLPPEPKDLDEWQQQMEAAEKARMERQQQQETGGATT